MLTRKSLAGPLAAGLLCLSAAPAAAAPADLDRSFGGGAFRFELEPGQNRFGTGAVALPDGSVIVNALTRIAKLRPDGALDKSFGGGDGWTNEPFHSAPQHGLTVDRQGRILVGGYGFTNDGSDAVVSRLLPNGELDKSFSGDGTARFSFSDTTTDFDEVLTLSVQDSGAIVVAGRANETFGAAVLTDQGTLDGSFSGDGVTLRQDVGNLDAAAVQRGADGAITAAGLRDGFFTSARLSASGAPDTSYGTSGLGSVSTGDVIDPDYFGAAFDAAGRVVVTGGVRTVAVPNGFKVNGVVGRITTAGKQDPAFGDNGVFRLASTSVGSLLDGIAFEPDGDLVVGGLRAQGADVDALLVRLRDNGRLDTGFGSGGSRVVAYGDAGDNDVFHAVMVGGDGRITAVGTSVRDGSNAQAFIAAARLAGGHTQTGGGNPPTGGGGTPSAPAPAPSPAPAPAPAPRPAAPRATLAAIKGRPKQFAGTATGAARVEVALVRRTGKRCSALTTTATLKFTKAACTKPKWLKATGTSSWKLTLKRALGRGLYQLLVRPIGADGKPGTTVQRQFRVR